MASRRTAVCTLAAVAAVMVLAAPAQARRSYCAPTGDYCVGQVTRGGQVFLGIDTFSFRGSFQLCVTSPNGNRKCLTFRLRRDPHNHHLYKSHVKWSDHFPHGQKGRYKAVWRYGGARFPSVTFTIG